MIEADFQGDSAAKKDIPQIQTKPSNKAYIIWREASYQTQSLMSILQNGLDPTILASSMFHRRIICETKAVVPLKLFYSKTKQLGSRTSLIEHNKEERTNFEDYSQGP